MQNQNLVEDSIHFFSRFKEKITSQLPDVNLCKFKGIVLESTSLLIRASLPLVSLGEICQVSRGGNNQEPLLAQVVGFREKDVFLMPFGEVENISPNSEVTPLGRSFTLKVGYPLLGRVLDGLGKPMDHLGEILPKEKLFDWPLNRCAPHPYTRKPVTEPMSLGIRAIDGFLTVGKGQRIGLFAGSGVGKSSLLSNIVKNTESQIVVVCLVGERGREVMEFINHSLSEESKKKCIMVVATSDTPSLVRYLSAFTATAIAEWFRDQGENVLFLMDSITRFARAQREIGLALGEPPARQGYPPSVFAQLPKLLERTGSNENGSITAIYSVLVQGGDMEEPIADEVRGILDGHIVLSRELAEENHWPAIDISRSLSRVMNNIIDEKHRKNAGRLRSLLAVYEKNRDLISLGAYQKGSSKRVDLAIEKIPMLKKFLQQKSKENSNYFCAQAEMDKLLRV